MSRWTVPHQDGVVVAVVGGSDTYLASIDDAGTIRQRRRASDFDVTTLGRYHDFVLATSPDRLALFGENLELEHDWRPLDTLVAAQAAGEDLVVLDGLVNSQTWWFSGTVRWLTLSDDGLLERNAVQVPIDLSPIPRPRLVAWYDGALVVGLDAGGWTECSITVQDEEVACEPAVWTGEIGPWSNALDWAQIDVVRSGVGGYAVTVPNGCAVWMRHYDRLRSITRGQFVAPVGRSDLGLVREMAAREWDGNFFVLTSALVDASWLETGDYRIALRKLSLSESSPLLPRSRIEGCLG